MLQRHFSRMAFFLLLAFTIGFIIGAIINISLNVIKQDIPIEMTLQNSLTYLVVVIFTSPDSFSRRQIIRKTWLMTKQNNSIEHYFAFGIASLNTNKIASLKAEHSVYRDLIFLDSFTESYSRLSEKLKEVLKWCDKNLQYKFLLKVDDDSFVQLNSLFNVLTTLPQEKLYFGYFDGQASVKTKGKWKEDKWFLCDKYVPYAKGGGYVLSQDLVHLIAMLSDNLSVYKNEDVSLGTWLSPFQINRIHNFNFDTEYRSRGCLNSYLITHKQTENLMKEKYRNLIVTGNICLKEYTISNAYNYNWNVLPSQCCVRTDKLL